MFECRVLWVMLISEFFWFVLAFVLCFSLVFIFLVCMPWICSGAQKIMKWFPLLCVSMLWYVFCTMCGVVEAYWAQKARKWGPLWINFVILYWPHKGTASLLFCRYTRVMGVQVTRIGCYCKEILIGRYGLLGGFGYVCRMFFSTMCGVVEAYWAQKARTSGPLWINFVIVYWPH